MDQLRLSGPARPGDVLGGRYRLEELIGEGGMGSVWRASDRTLERTVAVKVFWSGSPHETDASRRESEKRLLASVSHPSLVTLFDAHLSGDALSYLVMEYVDGGTLSSLIARGPVATTDAASLAADLGEALHVIHRAGIIHRDVKPANILLRPPVTPEHTFRAVLADFGIAHVMDATRVTTPGVAMGTVAYISPEQVRGQAPTPASDIYSLGLVLLEALSGLRAFTAETPAEAISVRLTTSPTVPGRWGYGWRSLLSAMTALDPDARPTALEVASRARVLDAQLVVPEETRPVALAEPLQVSAPVIPADEPTAILAVEHDAHIVRPAPPGLASRRDARERAGLARRRRRGVGGAIAVLAAAGAIGLTAWIGSAASAPTPTPLPELEQTVTTPTDLEPAGVVEPAPTDTPVVDPAGDSSVSGADTIPAPAPNTGGGNVNSGPGNNSGSGAGSNSGNGNGNGNGKGKGKNG